jgi:hypothetical protein
MDSPAGSFGAVEFSGLKKQEPTALLFFVGKSLTFTRFS